MDFTLLFSSHLQELLTMKPKIKAISLLPSWFVTSSNASVMHTIIFRRGGLASLIGTCEQAWDRGDPVAACRQSIHAAHLMNNTRSKGWGELEQTYWKTVVRFCKEAIQ